MFAAIDTPLQAFEPLFAQRALLAVLALALLAAAVGPAIVLRELPFFAHAVGGGAYPVLVLGVAIGAPLALMAPLGALVFALVLWVVSTAGEQTGRNRDAETALLVAASFALGAVLATTAFAGSFSMGLSPESLLFGSVLTAGADTIAVAFAMAAVCGAAAITMRARWLALGFDAVAPRPASWRAHEAALLAAIALAVAATLPLAGSLMGAALLVIPAASARVLTDNLTRLTRLTLALALTEGVIGLYLALVFNLPPGAAIATLAGLVFAFVATARAAADSLPRRRPHSGGRVLVGAAIVVVSALAVAGCGNGNDGNDTDGDSPSVVVTTSQLGDLARQVGGSDASVTTLLKPGTDPHDYEPTPSDVQALADADVVLYSGGGLDAWLTDALKSSGSGKTPVDMSQSVVLIAAAPDGTGTGTGTGSGAGSGGGGATESSGGDTAFNAHWYLDPGNLSAAAGRVRTELTKARPEARNTFRANADRYQQLVATTTAGLTDCGHTMPLGRRAVLTEHDDFQYLTEFLGVETAAQLRATGAGEASARDADEALSKARQANAAAVLVSKGEGGTLARTAAERLDVPLLQLYGDSLAERGGAATSLGAIAENSRQIVTAMGGKGGSCPRAAG